MNTKTYGQQFDEAIACETKEQAAEWLKNEIARYHTLPDFTGTDEDAKKIILTNLGYMAGYYDKSYSQKVYSLFGAVHPFFGTPDYWDKVTPEEAFEKGKSFYNNFEQSR